MHAMKPSGKMLLALFLAALVIAPFALVISAYTRSHSIITEGFNYEPGVSTRIYDINGELISELFDENRTMALPGTIPTVVISAFLCAEDRNFFFHPGFDIAGIARALIVDLFSGELRQGGSTITQQLVKQLYTKGEKTFHRKLTEIFLARELEKRHSKKEILEMYLNQIYFGHGVYGIGSAARFFFNKDLARITPVEAALLASIPSAPARFSPLRRPRAAFEKSRRVLHNMISAGYITREEARESFDKFWTDYLPEIRTRYSGSCVRDRQWNRAPYFTEHIRRILVERYGEEAVYRGGLAIHTTLDLRQQKAAEEALVRGLAIQNNSAYHRTRSRLEEIDRRTTRMRLKGRNASPGDLKSRIGLIRALREECADQLLFASLLFGLEEIEKTLDASMTFYERLRRESMVEGALIALDPTTGAITAMVGGGDFNSGNQLNRAVQSIRQPGSAFKAFVYGAGIESKQITAATAFYDVPVLFKGTRTVWKPSNYEKTYKGKVLVRRALAASLNIISVLVVDELDARAVAEFASRLMGISESRFSADPTLSLGTSEVSPLEMARGISVYANGGRRIRSHAILSIVNRKGETLYRHSGAARDDRVISKETAFIMTSLLRSVVDRGTATGAIRGAAGFHLPAAGKTGTTNRFKDAWFVGYTPDLAAAVWMGCDSPSFSLGAGSSAAAVAAPVWGDFMRAVYTFRKPVRFPEKPLGIITLDVCEKTGKIPVKGCPALREYFIKGTEPKEKCNSEHDEMISIFDIARKRKSALLERERSKLEEPDKDGPAE